MSRYNLQISTGFFAGTAVAQPITGIGFLPQLVICKVEGQNGVMRTNIMRGDSTGFLTSSNANLTTRITNLMPDGFNVGTGAQSNANGSNVYYLTIRGSSAQSYFRTFRYYGDGTDNRNMIASDITFTPDLVVIKGDAAVDAPWRSSAMSGDATYRFDPNGAAVDTIQNLQSNGFQVGTQTTVNGSGNEYHGFAMRSVPGVLKVGSFTGDGTAALSTKGLGFKPNVVIVKANAAQYARILTTDMVNNTATSMYMGTTTTDTTGILTLDADGFTVGSGASVNGNGVTSQYIAIKSGKFNVPISRNVS